MGEHSFDVVSKVDLQEVRNAFGQAEKEIATRYDLKRVRASLIQEGEVLVGESGDEFTLSQLLDVLKAKLVKRGVHLKSLRPGKVEPASGGRVRQRLEFQQGIPIETAKQLVAEVKRAKLKVQAAIQGDTVRVSGKNKDDLQTAMAALRSLDVDVPLTFTNYR
ncbi:MAG TPA: YajQ family cyclic di-GMP-binding protein [Thermoanaerobaculia bacterium]|nr:YajQ family cyclic di-GMP-binding protein [Thermoanaerobaculia bacterium]